jgi:hypothetical protein
MKTAAMSPASAERQVKAFIAKFEPKHQALIRSVRAALRKHFPTGVELAYDNYKIRVPSADLLKRPEVEALLSLAVAKARTPFPTTGERKLVIRSISAKQRPRRRATA